MSLSSFTWLIVVLLGIILSLANKKKKQTAAKAESAHRTSSQSSTATSFVSDEPFTTDTVANIFESAKSALLNDEPLTDDLETNTTSLDETSIPELEGTFRRYYAEAENEGELSPTYAFAEREGVRAISEEKLNASVTKDSHPRKSSTGLVLPNGQAFNLQTAMYYDIILHRRNYGLLRRRG